MVGPPVLVCRWREQAGALRRFGADHQAAAVEQCAQELEAALAEANDELLSLTAASRECGYSADHLGRLVRRGQLPNHGREHAPRVRRADLPRKPPVGSSVPLLRSYPSNVDMDALTREAIASKPRRSA